MRPAISGTLETSLYVDDVERSVRFYRDILGFRPFTDFGDRGCALEVGPAQVLLIFKKGASLNITAPHDGDGQLHVAFAIQSSDLEAWEGWLGQNGIAIEEETRWERGGISLYFRDPDGHCLELATPGVWPIY